MTTASIFERSAPADFTLETSVMAFDGGGGIQAFTTAGPHNDYLNALRLTTKIVVEVEMEATNTVSTLLAEVESTCISAAYNCTNATGSHEEPGGKGLVVLAVLGLILAILAVVTTIGNTMVIVAVASEKKLKSVSNYFIVSLAVADLLIGCLIMPLSAMYVVMDGVWPLGQIVCKIWIAFDYVSCTASILNIVILALDRYWSVTSPLKYRRKRTGKRAFYFICLVWCTSCLWIIPVTGWASFSGESAKKTDEFYQTQCDVEFSDDKIFKVITAAVNFYLPMIVMIFLYGHIYIKIRNSLSMGVGRKSTRFHSEYTVCNGGAAAESMKTIKEHKSDSCSITENENSEEDCFETPGTYGGCNKLEDCKMPALKQTAYTMMNINNGDVYSATKPGTPDARKMPAERSRGGHEYSPMKRVQLRLSEDKPSEEKGGGGGVAGKPISKWRRQGSTESSTTSSHPHIEENRGGYGNKNGYRNKVNSRNISGSSFASIATTDALETDPLSRSGLRRISTTRTTSSNVSMRMNRSQKKRINSELKALKQLGLIMGCFIVCWLPYFVSFTVIAFCKCCISETVHTVFTWLGYVNSTLNPLIYPFCNTTFRITFKKIISCQLSTKHKTVVGIK